MKKLVIFLSFFSFLCFIVNAQLPVNKLVKIIYAADKKFCLQKDINPLLFTIAPYKELLTQEWKILPSDEPNFYYLQLATNEFLKYSLHDNLFRFSFASDTLRLDSIDNYKFSIKSNMENEWEISPKKSPKYFLQPTDNVVAAKPKFEYSTTAFIIDTIPYRRPVPSLVTLKNSRCDAGVLKDLQPLAVFGADVTCFQPGGMYPAQFLLQIYLSADMKDRLEILIFDDVRSIKKKSYTIKENGPKNQPSIKLFVGDKMHNILNKASIILTMLVLNNNTFSLTISEASNTTDNLVNPSVYDIAIKGIYMLH